MWIKSSRARNPTIRSKGLLWLLVHSREVKRKREEKLLEKNMNKWGQIIMEEKMVLPQVLLQKSLMFKRPQNKLVNKLSMMKNLDLRSLAKLKHL
jgi:hypothetical protein